MKSTIHENKDLSNKVKELSLEGLKSEIGIVKEMHRINSNFNRKFKKLMKAPGEKDDGKDDEKKGFRKYDPAKSFNSQRDSAMLDAKDGEEEDVNE